VRARLNRSTPTHQSQAFGINDVGQVVGIRHDANGNAQATMWFSDGSATALGGREFLRTGHQQ
jgi:probable HAF family extracellular repeat protein